MSILIRAKPAQESSVGTVPPARLVQSIKSVPLVVSGQPGQSGESKPMVKLSVGGSSQSANLRKMVDANSYRRLTLAQQIYEIPDTYIGSVEEIPRTERLLDLADPKNPRFFYNTISLPEGIERLYLEILSNCGDNVQRSRERNVPIGTITIEVSPTTVSIRNGGIPIPVQINAKENMYAPEMIFGNLLTSSNYDQDEKKMVAGRNGYGAKLCNIFSKQFTVEVGDSYNKLHYIQTWTNNMKNRGDPIIKPYQGESYVKVTYTMDFSRFKYTQYTPEAIALFASHAADIAFTCKVPVTFNGLAINSQNVKTYAQWMYGDLMSNSFIHYEWPPGVEIVHKRDSQVAADPSVVPIIEMCVIDTPDNGSFTAYVNGMITRDGGVHTDAVYKAISDSILETVNKLGGGTKKKGDKAPRQITLTMADVKRHLSIVMSCRLVNPKFTSQSKTKLSSPKPKITIEEKTLKPVMKWKLIDRLYAELEAKHFSSLKKSDGKKRRHVDIPSSMPANMAGTKQSSDCTLYIVEGKSAMGYANTLISTIPNGRDYFGVFPMRGKPLNVMNATIQQIATNREFCDLKEIVGLREGADYLDDQNYGSLRYGRIMVLADADDDGKHILGLVLNYFHCRFPSLLTRGYVMYMRTPIIGITKGKNRITFYTQLEFDQWVSQTPNWKSYGDVTYYKGLGTSTDDDVKQDATNLRIVIPIYDDQSPQYFQLAFNEKYAENRKKWIEQYKERLDIELMQQQPISLFINFELIQHSLANIRRSIPRFDGLKTAHRQAIWGSMIKWGKKVGNAAAKVKTAQLASYVMEHVYYHHGPTSMTDTIEHMVLDYVGSNNLPYFMKDGQFGTRNMDGEDGANARYTFTRPMWWWPHIFIKDDVKLLTMKVEDGEEREPVIMLPIIPLGLVNGCNGIGTGHSTFIPNHNPVDICLWFKERLTGNHKPPPIKPWYRGFTGHIELKEKIKVVKAEPQDTHEDDPLGQDDVDFDTSVEQRRISMITTGIFRIEGSSIVVTELPIGRGMKKYEDWLTKLRGEKVITDFRNLSTNDKVYFEIKGFPNPSLRSLRLVRTYGMTNMVLLDSDGKPVKFETVDDILESFYMWRLPFYGARRQYIIDSITEDIANMNDKIRFIRAFIRGTNEGYIKGETIIVMHRKKTEVYAQMDEMKIPHKILSSTPISNCTEDEINKLTDDIAKLESKRQQIIDSGPEGLWLDDINEFLSAYSKYYKCVIPNKLQSFDILTDRRFSPSDPSTPSVPSGPQISAGGTKLVVSTPSHVPQVQPIKPRLVISGAQ